MLKLKLLKMKKKKKWNSELSNTEGFDNFFYSYMDKL